MTSCNLIWKTNLTQYAFRHGGWQRHWSALVALTNAFFLAQLMF
jgi:hypothetical protein